MFEARWLLVMLVVGPTTVIDTSLPWCPPPEPPEPHWCEADEELLRRLVAASGGHPAAQEEAPPPWAVPGVPQAPDDQRQAAAPDAVALVAAVEQALAADPVLLSGPTALGRARLLLEAHGRLAAAVLPALRDVLDRELWAHAQVGSARTWLRSLPSGEGSWLNAAALLDRRPVLSTALAEGAIALRTAQVVAAALDRVPPRVEAHQVDGVLSDGVASALAVCLGAGDLRPTPAAQARYEARRAELEAVACSAADAVLPADRLEPAFALLARVLPPGEVPAAVGLLVDALEPERLEDAEQRDWEGRELTLVRAPAGGWTLKGRLDEESGQLLSQLLQHHRPRRDERTRLTPTCRCRQRRWPSSPASSHRRVRRTTSRPWTQHRTPARQQHRCRSRVHRPQPEHGCTTARRRPPARAPDRCRSRSSSPTSASGPWGGAARPRPTRRPPVVSSAGTCHRARCPSRRPG